MKALLIVAVTSSLLWCPFRCLDAATVAPEADAATTSSPARCTCCPHDKVDDGASSSASIPSKTPGGCDCSDCVCKGAVLKGHSVFDFLTVSPLVNTVATSAIAIPENLLCGSSVFDAYGPPTMSGCDIVIRYGNIRR